MIDLMAASAAGLAGILGAVHVGSTALAFPAVRRRITRTLTATPRPSTAPAPITLLRPVCGRDAYDAETLATSFVQDHPQYEVIFCVADGLDPVVGLVQDLIALHPHVRARLLIGEDRITGNPKLNNLEKGWQAATHDVICIADSNILLPPDYLRTIVALLDTPGTGLVSSPPAGGRPQNWAARLECTFLNANQGRLQLAADTLGLGFAQGKTLACRRALIDGAGGLRALGCKMAEDVAATLLVREADLRVRLTPSPFVQPVGARAFADVWARQVRWSIVRRDGFAGLFLLEPLNGAVVPTLALAGALGLSDASMAWLGVWLAAWYATEAALARLQDWPMGWRDAVMLPLRDLLIPMIWAATLRRHEFRWRGNAVHGPKQASHLPYISAMVHE